MSKDELIRKQIQFFDDRDYIVPILCVEEAIRKLLGELKETNRLIEKMAERRCRCSDS